MGASSTLSDLYDQLNASGDYEFHHVEKYNTAPLIQVRSTVWWVKLSFGLLLFCRYSLCKRPGT